MSTSTTTSTMDPSPGSSRTILNPATGQPYPIVDAATNTYFVDPATFDRVASNVIEPEIPVAVPVIDSSGASSLNWTLLTPFGSLKSKD